MKPERYALRLGNHPRLRTALNKVSSPGYAADFLRRLNLVLTDEQYRPLFFDIVPEQNLVNWMQDPPLSMNTFETLQNVRLLPTPEILYFAHKEKRDARKGLENIMQQFSQGRFFMANPLHIELEYSKYRMAGPPVPPKGNFTSSFPNDMSLEKFMQLPWIEDQPFILRKEEEKIIKVTAQEAVDVLNFIRSKYSPDKSTLVIANSRYGSYFVIDPIKDKLTALGIEVVVEVVPSFDCDRYPETIGSISDQTWEYIAKHNPLIFVVDGTKNSLIYTEHGNLTRFPAAIQGYINAFKSYNATCEDSAPTNREIGKIDSTLHRFNPHVPYNFAFWSSALTSKIYVGKKEYVAPPFERSGAEIIFVTSTSGKDLDGGELDDPEDYYRRYTLGFTSTGLSCARISSNSQLFVGEVKKRLKQGIDSLLS